MAVIRRSKVLLGVSAWPASIEAVGGLGSLRLVPAALTPPPTTRAGNHYGW